MAEVFELGLRIVRIFTERPITRNGYHKTCNP